ncbi:hypothetical protein [Spiroplasma phoeniceum]|uniref:Transmembrane protein n=1 Tax=Spiroplasma phoeniceum P40 TaxID=1276259 RepID=A0A345DRY6_9MOLU|nr:hypothetical protein [Spiroplasma phoeniceum]AXF96977.1 hypothetical protein SDAV_002044 [Spiroplasma phoeniceum P40]
MYKLSKYSKKLKIIIITLMIFLIIVPISGVIIDLCDRMINYDYFKPSKNGHSEKTIDQLIAWLFFAFTNWYALYCVIYATVFLARLGYKNEPSEFKKFIITPIIAFILFGIFSYYEQHDFKYFIKRINYFSLILPILYIIFSWTRLVIYVECHDYAPTDGRIMWWNSYKILNPYLHPVLAPLIISTLFRHWNLWRFNFS